MGSGGLSSSGFRNAAVNAGADLSERIAAIRAQLRQQGAQGLFQTGQQGLQRHVENIHQPASPGLFQSAASGIGNFAGQAAGNYFSGGAGGASGNKVGANTSPYGSTMNTNYSSHPLVQQAQGIRG